jgi:hypothetical protein
MFSNGREPMPQTSEALIASHLNVCQHKLATVVIQIVHILYSSMIPVVRSQANCARDDLCMGNQFYFQIT